MIFGPLSVCGGAGCVAAWVGTEVGVLFVGVGSDEQALTIMLNSMKITVTRKNKFLISLSWFHYAIAYNQHGALSP
jgi:hypothetical protein